MGEINFSLTSFISYHFSLETLYPEAIWVKSLAFWFSSRGTCLMSTKWNIFRSKLDVTNYINRFSLVHLYSFFSYFRTNSESPLILTPFSLKSNKILRSAIRDLNLALLFEQHPWILNLNLVGITLREMTIIPMSVPFLCLEPSKYNLQGLSSKWFCGAFIIAWSTIKISNNLTFHDL